MLQRCVLIVLGVLGLVSLVLTTLPWPGSGPTSANLLTGVGTVAAGSSHTCALTTASGVKCWGANSSGQLGDGTTTDRVIPVDVADLTSGVTEVAAGGFHTCVLTTAGGVKCWGRNLEGQLGDQTSTARTTPVSVSGLETGVAAVAAGFNHTCALTTAGGVKCWGQGAFGQLGDAASTQRTTPVDVSGLTSGIAAIAAGGLHTCAVTTAGGVKCWGYNVYGELGAATTEECGPFDGPCSTTPVDACQMYDDVVEQCSVVLSDVAAVAAGGHTCALTTAGGLKCWGYNAYGQLGDGTTTNRIAPVDVSGLVSGMTVLAEVAVGHHTCAVTAGGLKCWGNNQFGQLGDGTTTHRTTPVDVSGLTSSVAAVAAGSVHTCALTMAGGVKCWGYNGNGRLGDGTTTHRTTPVDVVGLAQTPTGDANCNGQVNSIDATLVLQFVAGLVPSLPCQEFVDVNESGDVNSIDATIILQFVAGLLPGLPV